MLAFRENVLVCLLLLSLNVAAQQAPVFLRSYQKPGPSIYSDDFGSNVALLQDYVAIGCPYDDSVGSDSGAIFIYSRETGLLDRTLNGVADSRVGYALAADGNRLLYQSTSTTVELIDLNTSLSSTFNTPVYRNASNDGLAIAGDRVVVGNCWYNPSGPQSTFLALQIGAAQVYTATGVLVGDLQNPTPAHANWFGYSVAANETTIVVGAPGAAPDAESYYQPWTRGAVHIYRAADCQFLTTIHNPTGDANSGFGVDVALTESNIYIGACLDKESTGGAVYVYRINGQFIKRYSHSADDHGRYFGTSVGFGKNLVYAGGPTPDTGGFAYVYGASDSQEKAVLANPLPASGSGDFGMFGLVLSARESDLIVGAPFDSSNIIGNTGMVHHYRIPTPAAAGLDWLHLE